MLSPAMVRLKDALSCITYNGAQHTHIQIDEADVGATLRRVTLVAPQGDWISLDPDNGRKCSRLEPGSRVVVMSPLLAIEGHDHHRACDAVVVVNCQGALTLVYIDLKSSSAPVGYAGQFKSTRQFMQYALGVLKEFHGDRLTIAKERYVILHGGRKPLLDKRPSVSAVGKIGDTSPEDPYKKMVSNGGLVYLKELIG